MTDRARSVPRILGRLPANLRFNHFLLLAKESNRKPSGPRHETMKSKNGKSLLTPVSKHLSEHIPRLITSPQY